MSILKANYDKIIIRVIEDGESKVGNIIVPDMGKERPEMGEIVSVGPGFYTLTGTIVPCTLQIGQIVLIPKFSAQKITLENEDYIVCKESDVLAVIEKEQSPIPHKISAKQLLMETAENMKLNKEILNINPENNE